MMSCGLSCIKYLLFIFNFLFSVAGIGLIVAGGLALNYANYNLLEGQGQGPAIALIVIGCFIFVTAFLGCCGAIKENFCMLITFAVILIVIFIAQISIGITAAVYKDSFGAEIKKGLFDTIDKYDSDPVVRESWHEVQKDLKCCGVEGPDDWKIPRQVPGSCCLQDGPDETCDSTKSVYKEGCYEKLLMILKDGMIIIIGVGIGIAFIELAGAILACLLALNIRKEGEIA